MAKPNLLTADSLATRARAAIKKTGSSSWIDSHPHREAIIEALRNGAPPMGVARIVSEEGPFAVTRQMAQRVLMKIREGKI